MKLYLASYRIPTPDKLKALLGREFADTKVAIIPNAQDYYIERARQLKIRDVTSYLSDLGFHDITTVDLREFSDPQKLKNKLRQHDLIWVIGGNTFCLSYQMQRSGFSKVIKDVLEQGTVYGGESAGAIMAGNSLKGIEFADNPEFAEKIVWETLNLTDHFILPHADNPNFAAAIQKTHTLHKNNKSMIELNDNQALASNDYKIFISTQES